MSSRVLFPATGFTIADAVAYYRAIAKVLLPHVRRRPMSFKRYVDTIDGESFWEKDAPGFTPQWVKRVRVPRRTAGEDDIEYIVVNDVRTLAWVASIGGIELHPFLHRVPKLEVATHVVFDLDPGAGADLDDCCRVALLLRDALKAIRLESFAKVSGSKGLQVYVPLNTNATHASTEPFAKIVAEEIARAHPRQVVAKMAKALRRGKVLIDWSQNADYKTTVAVYSLRGKSARPYVSMPVTWREVAARKALVFAPEGAVGRVQRNGDLWGEVLEMKQVIPSGVEGSGRAVRDARPTRPDPSTHARDDRVRLPKRGSQSGRRLFVLTRSELWLDMGGKFRRWILRRDREGGERVIAIPAGDVAIDPAYYRGEGPAVEDAGAYEIVEGSMERQRFELWFSGKVMSGAWTLEKARRSWVLAPLR